MIQRLALGAAIMAIWALQTMITVMIVGASGQFTWKFITYLMG